MLMQKKKKRKEEEEEERNEPTEITISDMFTQMARLPVTKLGGISL